MKLILSIAGLALKVDTGHLKLPAEAWAQNISRQFVLDDNDRVCSHQEHLEVILTADPAPELTGCKRIFDSQDSWSVYARQDELYVTDQYPPFAKPVWTAQLCLKAGRVIVFCSSDIINTQTRSLALNPVTYPLDQIMLMNFLAHHEGVIVHAAGWAQNNSGWVFPGKSGAGKTTLAGYLSGLNSGAVLSDDRIVIRRTGHTFQMHGTPWPGEGGHAVNLGVELKQMAFLSKGSENRMAELSASDTIGRLLPVLSIPWYDKEKTAAMMAFCDHLISRIPAYELTFRADASISDFFQENANEFNT